MNAGPQRLLLRTPNWLGDAVMSMPAVQALAQRFPQATISVLTPAKLADLWAHHPDVRTVLPIAPGESPWSVGQRLRREQFDQAVIFPNSFRSALEVFFSRIPQRLGRSGRCRTPMLTQTLVRRPESATMRKRSPAEVRCRITTAGHRVRHPSEAHHVRDYLSLVAALGADPTPTAPRLSMPDAQAATLLRDLPELAPVPGSPPPLTLALNPGAEYGPAKRWPAPHFAAAARALSQLRPGVRWLILGGPADRDLCAEVARSLGSTAINLAGRTTLPQLMAALSRCALVLTNDTGPMHLAAALGTPVVALFGSTSPELTGPGLPGDPRHELLSLDVPCAPCFLRECPIDLRCLNGISVPQVVAAAQRLLDRRDPRATRS
jgi:heptosyltransferase-2